MRRRKVTLRFVTVAASLMVAGSAVAEDVHNWRDVGPFGAFSTESFPMCLRTRPRAEATTCIPALPTADAPPVQRVYAHEGRAIMYFRIGDYANSRVNINAALSAVPDPAPDTVRLLHLKARLDMSEAFNMANPQLFKIALGTIDRAIAREPGDLNLHLTKAVLLARDYRRETALAATMAVLKQDPSHGWAWQFAGQLHEALDQVVDGIAAFERALALNDDTITSRTALGRLYVKAGDPEAAIRHLNAAIEQAKFTPDRENFEMRATAHAMRGDPKAALQDLTTLIDGPMPGRTFPGSGEQLARVLVGRAFVNYELRHHELAAADVLKAVAIGGPPQILKMQLFLNRNGLSIKLDGEQSHELSAEISKCFAADRCRGGLATAL